MNNNTIISDGVINIFEIINSLLRKWWLILIFAVLGGTAMYIYSTFFVTPMYTANGSLYISSTQNSGGNLTLSTQQSNARFSETYTELSLSDSVLGEVQKKIEHDGFVSPSIGALRGMLSFSLKNETEVLDIRVSSTDPYLAREVANAMLKVTPAEISKIVKTGRAEVVDLAKLPQYPSSPNVMRNTIYGIFLGAIIAAAFIVLLNIFDLRIKPENDFEKMYSVPVLGNIPDVND